MEPDLPLIAGIAGMLMILLGFFGVQTHRLSQDALRYDVLNAAGSLLLVYYGVVGHAWPFVILNSVWALYSLKDIVVDLRKKKRRSMERQVRRIGKNDHTSRS